MVRKSLAGFILIQVIAAGAVCDVNCYGTAGDGKTLATAGIQKAIDACNGAGGGTGLFPTGTYLSGTILLKSNVTQHLDPGATLLGSANTADHNPEQVVYADGAQNIAIEGSGAIDGQGDSFLDKDLKPLPRPSPLIEIWNSQDIRIQDVTIRRTPGWGIHPKTCERVKIRGISILNNMQAIDTDGIDPDSRRNVITADSYIEAGEDCIVLKTTNRRGIATRLRT